MNHSIYAFSSRVLTHSGIWEYSDFSALHLNGTEGSARADSCFPC